MSKLIFFGTPEFAVPVLKKLFNSKYLIKCVYTQPPKKSNRGQKITKSQVQKISEDLNINLRTPVKLDENIEEYKFMKSLKSDLAIVVAYGQIIPKKFLDLPRKGFINIHASILPKYRGAAPIQRSIMNLEKKTGISIMKMCEKLDSGPVCNKYEIDIKDEHNFEKLSKDLSNLASEKIIENINNIFDNNVQFVNQDHNKATYAAKIEKNESIIKWDMSAENLLGKINGLYPNPGACFYFNKERYKILKAEVNDHVGEIGIVLKTPLIIGCKNKSIKVLKIQRAGKSSQNIEEFIIGSRITVGTNLN